MRRSKNFTITKESLEEQVKDMRYHPCLEITFRDRIGRHKHKISAGYSDEIHVFRNHGETLVLSFNPGLGYAGLEAFQGDERINDVYLSGSEMLAAFGEDDLEPARMIGILQEWL
jgi:hypothetical protein